MIKRIIALVLVGSLFWLSPVFAKNPVLLVPGINSISQDLLNGCLVKTFENAGYKKGEDLFLINFPNRAQGLIQEDVKLLKEKIDYIKSSTATEKVDIVAYSRGGLIAEFYTMMYGDQYQSSITYEYYSAGKPKKEKFKKTQTITDIPHYDNDINQIIMLGVPHGGVGWANVGRDHPGIAKKIDNFLNELNRYGIPSFFGMVGDTPDVDTVGLEQVQMMSSFYDFFWDKELNPDVKYSHLDEDRIDTMGEPGDGVVSISSAMGVHPQIQLNIKKLSSFSPDKVKHADLYKNQYVKGQLIQEIFSAFPITARISISPAPPVREGGISINVTLSDSLPSPPTLFVRGNGAFSSPQPISLSGSGKNFSGTLNIYEGTDGQARLYFKDKYPWQVKIPRAQKDCEENPDEMSKTIELPITGEYSFNIDTEYPVVISTTPADEEIIYTDTAPIQVKISATLFDPPINGYASGIKPESILLKTPNEWVKEQTQTNNILDYVNKGKGEKSGKFKELKVLTFLKFHGIF